MMPLRPSSFLFAVLLLQASVAGAGSLVEPAVPSMPGAVERGAGVRTAPPDWAPLAEPDAQWIEDTLASMTLEQKVGQMIMPQWSSGTAPSLLATYQVGGFVFLAQTSTTLLNATNSLQAASATPLLFAIDCEAGSGARVNGGTRFPMNMALGASQRSDLAYEQGRVTARECRALGIQIGFGPVLDVNTEPINPIIGIRAYSDDPARVTALARAYTQGATAGGMLCTFKHFPGHGATDGDSHQTLPIVDITAGELNARHVAPYATLVSEGLGDLVMSAHVWFPALDPGPNALPATLSTAALTGIGRGDVGFARTIVSDAFNMTGLTAVSSTYDAARLGVQAGLDIILMPNNVPDAYNGVRDAVLAAQISEARIDDSVRRILALKSRVGLPAGTTVSLAVAQQTLQHPDHLAAAAAAGAESICTALVEPGEFPLVGSESVLVVPVAASNQIFYLYPSTPFTDAMTALLPGATISAANSNPTTTQINNLVAQAASRDRIVVALYDWRPSLAASKQNLVNALAGTGKPLALVSFGSPYHIQLFPGVKNFYCGFSSHDSTQAAMAEVLTGEAGAGGSWPVDLGFDPPLRVEDWDLHGGADYSAGTTER